MKEDRYSDQWNRIESLEIDSEINGQLAFGRSTNDISIGQCCFQQVIRESLDTYMQKLKERNSRHHKKINLTWSVEFNVNLQVLEDGMGEKNSTSG